MIKNYTGSVSLVLFAVLVCLHRSMAQDINDNSFIRCTRQDGLSNNYITGLVQDADGYIWVATQKGLNRFDGKVFTTVFRNSPHSPLPDNLLVTLRAAGNNLLMGVTAAGAFCYDPVSRRSVQFIIPADSCIYFWTNFGYDIAKDKRGNYAVSTKTGLYIFNGKGTLIRRHDHYTPAQAGATELLFGNWVHTLSDGRVLQRNRLGGSLYDAATNTIDTIYVQKNKALKTWFSNNIYSGKHDELFVIDYQQNGIQVIDWKSGRSRFNAMPFSLTADIDSNYKICYISDSLLAIPCKVGGFYLFHYDPLTKQLTTNNRKYFNGKLCTAILKDRDGRLWIGTKDGLYMQNLRNSFFNDDDLAMQYPPLLNHDISSIYADDHLIYTGLGNNGGLLITGKQSKKIYQHIDFTAKDIASNTIADIFPYHKDTLWLGTGKGLLWFNKRNYHYGRINIPGDGAWANAFHTLYFLEDSKNNIWISFGRYNSLLRYNRVTRQFTTITAQEHPMLKVTFVFSMAEDQQGNIWLAGDGLCRWNTSRQQIDTLIPYPTVQKALRNFMLILGRDDDNNLWLSSFNNEIMQFNCSTQHMYLREQDNNWMDGNTVTSSPIIHNNIWLGTDNGISAFNINSHTVRQFTHANGLSSVAITSYRRRSYYDAAANLFYIGAGHHLISFRPDETGPAVSAPKLLIDKVLIRDSVLPRDNGEIQLRYFQNDVSVVFNAVNFTDPEENRFAWRMAGGVDTSWQDLDQQNSITLTNLAAGRYRVQVKLFSINNHWPQQMQELRLRIHPPFWVTAWFIALLSAFVLAVVYFVGRWRISEVKKKERVNEQLAEAQLLALQTQMNPHFIFNALNSIKRMILDGENANGSRYLSKFAFMIRLTLEHSKKPFVTLQETIEYLVIYLEMEQLRFGDAFTYGIDAAPELDEYETMIPSMMIQPLVENAIWHGLMPRQGKGRIYINFLQEDDKVVCCIKDNGIGIRASEKQKQLHHTMHRSVGLDNLRNRIKIMEEKYRMNFSFDITDLREQTGSGSGTAVVLAFNANNR